MTNTPLKKPFILVDGSSYLFRAYHALPPLTNSKGEPTGAMYGVLNMLRKLVKEYEPDYMAVVFDPKGKTFRDELYPEYKANRTMMPDELKAQIQPLHEMIKASGWPLLIIEGVEADDVIATLALEAKKKGMETLISTMDKDLAQLVNEKITLINTMSNRLLNPEGVKEKFGVPPELIIDYMTLIGDPIDNVPGIPKVGPKTAAKWLTEYQSLDNIIQHADEIKGKVGENLREHLKELPLGRQLVTVKTDVELPFHPEDLKPSDPDKEKLLDFFTHYEFKTWLSEILSDQSVKMPVKKETKYEMILEKSQLKKWLEKLKKAPYFAFDTETTHLNPMQAELVGVSFSVTPNEAAYVPLNHDYEGAPKQLDRDNVIKELKSFLENPKTIIVGQNLKYDIEVLKNYGIEIKATMQDTLLESYVLNSTSARHDLNTLALKYLGENTITFESIAGKGIHQLTFNQISLDKATQYAAEDADITLRLHEKLWPKIEKQKEIKKVLTEIEWPLMPVLAYMEYNGVLIDKAMLLAQSENLQKRIKKLEKKAHDIAGAEFNLGSPKQLQFILYEKLQLPIFQKTPKGQPSTAENVLQELTLDYPLPKIILEYRTLSKLKSTYTDRLPQQINPKTGRVHTSYNQTVTSTGRLSSTDPNLQNIPIRTEEGRKIRQAFISPKEFQIISADYSQVELRIMAHLSKDPGLLKAFKKGLDIHRATAAEVFGVELEQVTPEQRRRAKAINFGLMYGMSSFGLAQQLGTDRKTAQKYMDVYFARYPKVHDYMEQSRKMASEKGYVETLLGRRLYIPEIKVSNLQRRRAAERAAINAPLQGTAADIIKLAMISIHQWLENSNIEAKMIMQVHDELVFEAKKSKAKEISQEIKKLMEKASPLSIPLVVETGIGDNWDEAH